MESHGSKPMRLIIASCNVIPFERKKKSPYSSTRNRLIFFLSNRTQPTLFCLPLAHAFSLFSQINMNYEKWPFNLGFSQFDRCILFRFQLWFCYCAIVFRFFEFHSSVTRSTPIDEFINRVWLLVCARVRDSLSNGHKTHSISNAHVSMPIDRFQLLAALSSVCIDSVSYNRISWAIDGFLIFERGEEKNQLRFDHHHRSAIKTWQMISENRTSSKRTEQLTWKQDVKRRASALFSLVFNRRAEKKPNSLFTHWKCVQWSGEHFRIAFTAFKNKTSGWMKTAFEVEIDDQTYSKKKNWCVLDAKLCSCLFCGILLVCQWLRFFTRWKMPVIST